MKEQSKIIESEKTLAFRRDRKKIVILIWFIVLAVLISAWLVELITLETVFVGLAEALFVTFLITPFVEYYTKNIFLEEITRSLCLAIQGDSHFLKKFAQDQRENFINNSIESILGKKYGNILSSVFLKQYINRNFSFREKFEYNISYSDKFSMSDDLKKFKITQDYYLVNQSIIFSKIISEQSVNSFKLAFTFKEKYLSEIFSDHTFIFREFLALNEDAYLEIKKNASDFITNILTLKIFIREKDEEKNRERELKITLNEIIDSGIILKAASDYNLKLEDELIFRIQFTMPQLKQYGKFFVILGELTCNPEINFKYIKEKMKIQPLLLFDQTTDSEISSEHLDDVYKIKKEGWVIPRSAVIFLWKT